MFGVGTNAFLLALLASNLVVAASAVGLLVLLLNKLRRPWVRLWVALVAGGVGLAACHPALMALSGLLFLLMRGELRDDVDILLHHYRYVFQLLGAPAAIFGASIGLMAWAGIHLWGGIKRSRLRTALGLLLILLAWLVLGLGLTFAMLFLGAISR